MTGPDYMELVDKGLGQDKKNPIANHNVPSSSKEVEGVIPGVASDAMNVDRLHGHLVS